MLITYFIETIQRALCISRTLCNTSRWNLLLLIFSNDAIYYFVVSKTIQLTNVSLQMFKTDVVRLPV